MKNQFEIYSRDGCGKREREGERVITGRKRKGREQDNQRAIKQCFSSCGLYSIRSHGQHL